MPSLVAKSEPDEKKQIRQRSRGRWNSDLKVSLVVRPSFRSGSATQENLGSKIKTSKQKRSEASQSKILSLSIQLLNIIGN